MNITIEQPHHAAAIDTLLDNSFGPNRAGKTVYRLRENVAPVAELSLVAVEDDAVVGTIRYWPILIGGVTPTILLGPIAVDSSLRSGVSGMLGRWPVAPTPTVPVELAARQNAGAGAGFGADRWVLNAPA